MGPRQLLGAADVSDERLAAMVAEQLGVDAVELLDAEVTEVDYDLDALTTAGRYWVAGHARHAGGTSPFRFFVKVVQTWGRSPLFAVVPEEHREMALASVPWRSEPEIYRSDLGDRLPPGLSMPRAFAVVDLDEESAAIWLEAVDVAPARWDPPRFAHAARLLGRLAARAAIAPLGGLGMQQIVRTYAFGRLGNQVVPALRDDGLWHHPLIAASFGDDLRARLLAAAERLPAFLDELDALPLGVAHGDACTRNLLLAEGRPEEFVLIDFGFWCVAPLGFDLGQLLLGEVQMGERPAAELPDLEERCLPAFVEGLREEGSPATETEVRRAHALTMLLFAGLSALPFEHLGTEVTPELVRVARERAAAAAFVLDLVDATSPSSGAGRVGLPTMRAAGTSPGVGVRQDQGRE